MFKTLDPEFNKNYIVSYKRAMENGNEDKCFIGGDVEYTIKSRESMIFIRIIYRQ